MVTYTFRYLFRHYGLVTTHESDKNEQGGPYWLNGKNQNRITVVGLKTKIVTVGSVHVDSPHKYVYPTAGCIDVVAKVIHPYPAQTYACYYLTRSYMVKSLIL